MKSKKWCRHVGQIADPDPIIATAETSELAVLFYNPAFKEGTGKRSDLEHNRRWLKVTRPIVEAFFHARYFLEMAAWYGRTLETPATAPERLGSFSRALRFEVSVTEAGCGDRPPI